MTYFWENLKHLWRVSLFSVEMEVAAKEIELEKRIKALKDGQDYMIAVVNHLRDEAEESAAIDILQSDPIDLFKEDRQPFYTDKAIKLMARLQIKDLNNLIVYTAKDLMQDGHRVGVGTASYIDHCLRRHGLQLRTEDDGVAPLGQTYR